MKPQPQHMRGSGNKRQYHVPKDRYRKQRLEDQMAILRKDKIIADLRDMVEYLEFKLQKAEK